MNNIRAVIIATGDSLPGDLLKETLIPEIRPLVGRPWIEHVLETLRAMEIRRFSIIICRDPETVRGILGNGAKWGASIDYHTVRTPGRAYARLRTLPLSAPDKRILLAHGNRLPDLSGIAEFATFMDRSTVFCTPPRPGHSECRRARQTGPVTPWSRGNG